MRCGMPSASRMLPSVSGPRLSQHSCMLRVRRCRVLNGVMAPVFAKNAAASRAVRPIISDRARPPAASGNRRGSRRPRVLAPRDALAGRSPDRRGHRRRPGTSSARPAREAPSSRFSMTAPMNNSFVASRTRNSTSSGASGRGSERSSSRHSASTRAAASTTRGGRPERSMDEGAGRGYCRTMLGFETRHRWRCGAFPPSPARPCRRDKILPWSGPLSRIADLGRSSRHKKRTKSMT